MTSSRLFKFKESFTVYDVVVVAAVIVVVVVAEIVVDVVVCWYVIVDANKTTQEICSIDAYM